MTPNQKVGLLIAVLFVTALGLAMRTQAAATVGTTPPKSGTCSPSGAGCPFGPPPVVPHRTMSNRAAFYFCAAGANDGDSLRDALRLDSIRHAVPAERRACARGVRAWRRDGKDGP